MKKAAFILIFAFLNTLTFGQLTLQLEGSVPADSIFFSNITQDKEFQFIRYAPVINIKLNGALNDMYNFTFYTGGEKKMNQLWLNGDRVIIKGTFTGKLLEIDTVIGSDLYYKALHFRDKFNTLLTQPTDSAAINTFLLEAVKQNLGNPYSIELARNFLMRNITRKDELRKLYTLLDSQDQTLRNHLLNPYKKIVTMLTRSKLELSRFNFYTPDGKLEPLKLSPGKRYLIDMWFVGCAPCIEQHKEIASVLTTLKNNNIEVIGISIDRDENQWKNFLKKKAYSWTNVREVEDPKKMLRTDMLIESYPTYFLIDSEGTILYQANAFRDVASHLKLQTTKGL